MFAKSLKNSCVGVCLGKQPANRKMNFFKGIFRKFSPTFSEQRFFRIGPNCLDNFHKQSNFSVQAKYTYIVSMSTYETLNLVACMEGKNGINLL